jgi:hypothetical protein
MTAETSGSDRFGDRGAVSRSSHRSAHNATSTFTGTAVYGGRKRSCADTSSSAQDDDEPPVRFVINEAILPVVVATIM